MAHMDLINQITDGQWEDESSIDFDSAQQNFIPIAQKMNVLNLEMNFLRGRAHGSLEHSIYLYNEQIKWYKRALAKIGTVSFSHSRT